MKMLVSCFSSNLRIQNTDMLEKAINPLLHDHNLDVDFWAPFSQVKRGTFVYALSFLEAKSNRSKDSPNKWPLVQFPGLSVACPGTEPQAGSILTTGGFHEEADFLPKAKHRCAKVSAPSSRSMLNSLFPAWRPIPGRAIIPILSIKGKTISRKAFLWRILSVKFSAWKARPWWLPEKQTNKQTINFQVHF